MNFVFGMIFMFDYQGLLNKKQGHISKKGFTIMLITWLIDRGFLTNV
jgi:hypothetical protein